MGVDILVYMGISYGHSHWVIGRGKRGAVRSQRNGSLECYYTAIEMISLNLLLLNGNMPRTKFGFVETTNWKQGPYHHYCRVRLMISVQNRSINVCQVV